MLDTVKLRTEISAELATEIERSLQRISRVDLASGQMLYELTTGSLEGSWDSSVSVRLMGRTVPDGWDIDGAEGQPPDAYGPWLPIASGSKQVFDCVIEGSVHKAMMGHNVYGGPCDPVGAMRWFVADIGRRLGVILPDGLGWHVGRVDWAEVYRLPPASISQFFRGILKASYPRRKLRTYGQEGIQANGTTSGIKAYHKGPEFRVHDRPRLRDAGMDLAQLVELEEMAAGLIRFESTSRPKSLKADFEGEPMVHKITREYLERFHDDEVFKLLKEAEGGLQIVRASSDVKDRLKGLYSKRMARTLFGLWMELAAFGEKAVLADDAVSRASWYRHRAMLVDAGVSWNATDVHHVEGSAVPEFAPVRSSCLRLTAVDGGVYEKCLQYAA